MNGAKGEPTSDSTGQLERIRALAEDQATQYFGDALPAPWQPSGRLAASTAWAWLAGGVCMIVAALAAGGWVLAQGGTPPPTPASPLSRQPWPLPATEAVPAAKAKPRAGVQPATATAAVAPTSHVERIGGVWRIHAESASRHEVARELAELSRTELRGGAGALRAARPLNLRWEGHELAQAWQAVIGDEASYALDCRTDRCTAWIIDPAPAVEKKSAARRVAASPNFVVAPPAPVELAPAERSAHD